MSTPAGPIPDAASAPGRRWKPLAVGAIVVIAAGVGVVVWLGGEDRQREAALDACRAGKFAEAEPALKEALTRHPDDVPVLECLARGYMKAEQYADAEPYLSRLLELRPDDPELLRQRMTAYAQLKQREKAYADNRRLLEFSPTDTELRRVAIIRGLAIGLFPEAEDDCRTLLREQPQDRRLRIMLSNIRKGRGDDADAARILDEMIGEDGNDYAALLARGILFDETGLPDPAIPLLRKVFDADPSQRRVAGTHLGKVLNQVGRHEEAERVLAEANRLRDVALSKEAIAIQPDNLELKVRLAEDLLRDGNFADGVGLLEAVLKRSPSYAPAHRAIATHYEKQGRPGLAAKHWQLAGKAP